jgi:hypothetical protein
MRDGGGVELEQAAGELLFAYQSALSAADQLSLPDQLLAQHSVAVSSSKAATLLATRTSKQEVIARFRIYAAEAARADTLATAAGLLTSPVAKRLYGLFLGGLTVGGIASIVLALLAGAINAAAGAGAATAAVLVTLTGSALYFALRAGVVAAKGLAQAAGEAFAAVERLLSTESAASATLRATLDPAEQRLFAVFHRRPPRRPLINVLYRASGLLLLAALALGVLLGLAFVSGLFSGGESPAPAASPMT